MLTFDKQGKEDLCDSTRTILWSCGEGDKHDFALAFLKLWSRVALLAPNTT